jgi:hypothetical protein
MPAPVHQPDRYFRFLRRLRAGGRSNMYGAVPYLMRTFALDRDQAFSVVCQWLDQQQLETVSLQSPGSKPTGRKTGRSRAA